MWGKEVSERLFGKEDTKDARGLFVQGNDCRFNAFEHHSVSLAVFRGPSLAMMGLPRWRWSDAANDRARGV